MCKPGEECEGKGDTPTYMDDLATRLEKSLGEDFMIAVMPLINASLIYKGMADYAIELRSNLEKEKLERAADGQPNLSALVDGVRGFKEVSAMMENAKDAATSLMEMRLRATRLILDELMVPQSIRQENRALLTEIVACLPGFDMEKITGDSRFERDWAPGGVFSGLLEANFCNLEAAASKAKRVAAAEARRGA